MGQNHSGYSRIDRGEEPKSEPQIVFVSLGIVEIEEDQAGYRESTTDILSGAGVYGTKVPAVSVAYIFIY